MEIGFTKMHGAGNDYIYVNMMDYPLQNPEELAAKWSIPHKGIGADGLVLVGPSEKADFSMRIFNADGSEAKMCGNATRCIGKLVYDTGLTCKTNITLETLSGVKKILLNVDSEKDEVNEVTVDMGKPSIGYILKELTVNGNTYAGTVISMGNPHFVIFVNDIEQVDITTVGALLERNPFFPDRTNVEFAQVMPDGEIRMRVWERGSGVTLACGTGACATAVAGLLTGRCGREVNVAMDGGKLFIRWDRRSEKIFMTGDAVRVYEGYINL